MTSTVAHPRIAARVTLTGWREFALAAFLFAGVFKSALPLPFDLTVLLAGAVALATVSRIYQTRWLPRGSVILMGFWAVMLLGVGAAAPGYGTEKVARFFTLTFLAAVSAPVLLRDVAAVQRFGGALVVLGGLTTLSALLNFRSLGVQDRLQAFDANTIALGRSVGAGLVAAVCLWFAGRLNALVTLVLAIPMVFVMIASGSRGPLVAGALAVLPALFSSLRSARGLGRLSLLSLTVLLAGVAALPLIPSQSLARLQTFFSGDLDRSSFVRAEALRYTLPEIANRPFGVGFGRFEEVVLLSPSADPITYPHNVLLEVGLEAGWLPLLLLLIVLTLALYWTIRSRAKGIAKTLPLALLLFALVNALVSGDLNDNRLLWAGLGLALSVPALSSAPPAPSTSRSG